MPKALFTSKNLIGDSLYVEPSLTQWAKDHEGWEIDLLTLNDHIAPLYEGMGIPNLRVVFERDGSYDFEHEFQVNKAFALGDERRIHITTAYGVPLGYDLKPARVAYHPSDADDHERGLILFSMYSNSCASRKGQPPNKMLSWAHWWPILSMVRQLGPRIGVLGGSKERVGMKVSEDEYYTGLPLEKVARMMRDAKLLLTIDNGMGHLAASQGTPTILFYPACLGAHWIVPSGNPKLYVLQMDPTKITVPEASLFVREALKVLWSD